MKIADYNYIISDPRGHLSTDDDMVSLMGELYDMRVGGYLLDNATLKHPRATLTLRQVDAECDEAAIKIINVSIEDGKRITLVRM